MRHAPFSIGPAERDAWLAAMNAAVREAGATDDVEARLLDYFATAAAHMVNTPD
jgi:hemoglobin